MSPYNLLVFAHILAAFILVGGIVVQRVGLILMRSATPNEVLAAYRTYAASPRLIIPAVVSTFVTGLILAWFIGYTWRALWISATVVLLVALEAWRGIVVAPLIKRMVAMAGQVAADPAAHGGAMIALARQPRFVWGYVCMDLTTLTILALMVFKPMAL